MRRSALLLVVLASHLFLCRASLHAAADAAVVRKVIGRASAPREASLPPGTSFTTGARSKSELVTARGVMRVGQNAQVETTARGLALRQGLTLVSSEPRRFRKTIEVRAPGYRLKVRGTVQVAFEPGRSLKVVVMEGSATVALDSLMGEFETLAPGQMLIINPTDNRLPEPVEVDIQRLVATSGLTGGELGPLASLGGISASASRQETAFNRGDAVLTELLLRGTDNALEILRDSESRDRTAAANRADDRPRVFGVTPTRTVEDTPDKIFPEREYVFPDGRKVASKVGTMEFARGKTQNVSRAGRLVANLTPDTSGATAQPPSISGEVTASKDIFAGSSKSLFFRTLAAPTVDAEARRLKINTPPGSTQKTSVTTPSRVGLSFSGSGGLDVDNAILTAGEKVKGAPDGLLALGTPDGGITVTNESELVGAAITLNNASAGRQIVIDRSKLTAQRRIDVGRSISRTNIIIRNSSDLVSLANLAVICERAAISLESASKLTAHSAILVDSFIKELEDDAGNPDETPGPISLTNVQLQAPAIRVRGFGSPQDALVIDGARFNPEKIGQLIELYAEGAGTLRFKNNVLLNTKRAVLAGAKVIVDSGGLVEIKGRGEIYTDDPQYNTDQRERDPNYGKISTIGKPREDKYSKRPPF